MPTVLDTAKEATYTALGLNVLFLDEVSERFEDARDQLTERFSGPRKQLDEQLDIARDHAKKAQTDWQKQADEFSSNVKERMPFDVDEVTDDVQDRLQPVARRAWEAAEPAVNRLGEIAPAPLDGYVKDGVTKIREFLAEEAPVVKPAAKKTATKKPAAKKATAKKTTRKPAAKKAASK